MKANAGGFVYAIGQAWDAPVKIGVAANIGKRLDNLQAGNHVTLQVLWHSAQLPDPFAVESLLHHTFDAFRVRGEWFIIEGLTAEKLSAAADVAVERAPRERKEFDVESATIKSASDFLLNRLLRQGLNIEDAIGSLAKSTGLGRSVIWAQRYRPPAQIMITPYASIAAELWRVMGQPPFGTIPSAEDVQAVLRGESAPIRKPPRNLATLTALTDNLAAAISEAEAALGNTSVNTSQSQGEIE